jgi:hypothetical protein
MRNRIAHGWRRLAGWTQALSYGLGLSELEPNRIEILRLPNGLLALSCYQNGEMQLVSPLTEADLASQLANNWPDLPVYLHSGAAPLAVELRAAGRKVRKG